jgi:hypothetical protein
VNAAAMKEATKAVQNGWQQVERSKLSKFIVLEEEPK